MSSVLASLASALIKGLLEMAAPLLAYYTGRKSKEAEKDKKDAEVLKRQRDNDVTSIDDARRVWNKLRSKR